ncbi:MAG: transposase [Alphaproteobacteria bacterium]|nr:transposase [Alphaproteobacteria bacterium]
MMRSKHEAATLVATSGEATLRIEIVTDRRRAHGAAFRTIVVAEASEPGARVQDVAARHGICPSLVYRWRRLAGGKVNNGSSMGLFPVRIAPSLEDSGSAAVAAGPGPTRKARRAGIIEIELSGGIRVSVDEGVSISALRRVMSVLRG